MCVCHLVVKGLLLRHQNRVITRVVSTPGSKRLACIHVQASLLSVAAIATTAHDVVSVLRRNQRRPQLITRSRSVICPRVTGISGRRLLLL